MKLLIILCTFLIPINCSAECLKTITVQVFLVRSNPNPLARYKPQEIKDEVKKINVDCSLYKDLKVGDRLSAPDDPVDSLRLFSKDRGVLQRKHYEVLSLK